MGTGSYPLSANLKGRFMSNKGIFTALSGAMAQGQRLDTIANNIANVNTPSFKKDKQVFNEYLTANEKLPDVILVPRVPSSIESFYDMQGGDRGYVNASGTYTDPSQGALKHTGNSLDLALEGRGYLEVLTPQGVRLTRNGALTTNSEGYLVTKKGYPILSAGVGQAPEQRMIQVSPGNLTVSYSGSVYSGGQQVADLSIVNVADPDSLQKVGNSEYKIKPNYDQTVEPAKEVKIHQGFLEASNVNIIAEMTDMISATRTFESAQRVMKAFDEMNGRLVNDVPRIK